MATIDPKDLIGRTILKDAEEDGQRFRARFVRDVAEKKKTSMKELSILSSYLKYQNLVLVKHYLTMI
jgi:hypothetical protein